MQKFLLIIALLGILLYFISNKIIKAGKSMAIKRQAKQGYVLVDSNEQLINKVIKSCLYSVGIGVILLAITLFLAMKVKILLLMLPISLYLIGQILILNNHLKYAKEQEIWFNPQNSDVLVEWTSGNQIRFNLLRDIQGIRSVKAIQKNNKVLFGYYELIVQNNPLYIPFLLEENPLNKRFFQSIKDNYTIAQKSSLFPMI
ncbi:MULTISPECIES: hypothetical protein [Sphingobacterium]|uniref:PH domain-containing protein n=1 Tax=Sphingobacterium tenebrionis TaxID=3111775 RepID=A0ABU8I7D1_9SPHI|nr:hypothetical protein [Sphingobacterium sp. CZ-2]QBR11835.1 hypothetical protein E3D81_06500 [Sphingobacterium sp. CZ-2]